MKVGIIGGSGIYDSEVFQTSVDSINTPYGKVVFERGVLQDEEIFFLPRHGKGHSIPPHLINYRANIAAFKELGVERILATSAVGSLRADLSPGTFVVLNQFLDFTKRRALLFDETSVKHIDFTEPYCKKINTVLRQELKNLGIKNEEGCYVCTEGPRYETPAEVKMFSLLGGDVVGMTNVPEVTLAKEAG
ncbi:MAG: MTAP family purine nucleoside phosphorylase, partial [Bacillota bacterium]